MTEDKRECVYVCMCVCEACVRVYVCVCGVRACGRKRFRENVHALALRPQIQTWLIETGR